MFLSTFPSRCSLWSKVYYATFFSPASTQPTCSKKLFPSTAATGNPHRILSTVIMSMTTLTAIHTKLWCQSMMPNISIPLFHPSAPPASKANKHGTECIIPTPATALCEIPTRISQKIQMIPSSIIMLEMMTPVPHLSQPFS